MLSKTVIRQAFRTNLDRDDHDANALSASTRALCARLAEFLKNQTGLWAGFEALGFEADIHEAIQASPHIRWAYPRVEHEMTLGFYEVTSRADLVKNQWGIAEPDPSRSKRVSPETLNGLLIPGLAFDLTCNRLGRGRGYYDRALAEILRTNQPLKVGIALERQISETPLPLDAHDIAMNLVITDARILKGPVS